MRNVVRRMSELFEDYPQQLIITLVATVALVVGAASGPGRVRAPIDAAWIISMVAMFALPPLLVFRHRQRQQKALNRIRAIYASAIQALHEERTGDVHRSLEAIKRWEAHWQLGDSAAYRSAFSVAVIVATIATAAVHFLLNANVYSQFGYGQHPHASIRETVIYLLANPVQLWGYTAFSLGYGLMGVKYLRDLSAVPWSDFYGRRLAEALAAGRAVGEKITRSRAGSGQPTAREIFGLPERFNSGELRRAYMRLVRELHPDRWASATADVHSVKEAAMKRVNAARDELVGQAVG